MSAQPDLSKLSGELYRQWEKAMTDWWDQVLESPAFLGAMGQNLSSQAKARAGYEDAVDRSMEQLHLPSRKDLTRLAQISSMLEDRLLSMEDRLLEMSDRMDSLEKEVLRARVESAEGRIELRERLMAMESRLAAMDAGRSAAPVSAASTTAASAANASTTPAGTTSSSTAAASAATARAPRKPKTERS